MKKQLGDQPGIARIAISKAFEALETEEAQKSGRGNLEATMRRNKERNAEIDQGAAFHADPEFTKPRPKHCNNTFTNAAGDANACERIVGHCGHHAARTHLGFETQWPRE